MRIDLEVPSRFHFRRTVLSHGWATLPPFRVGSRGEELDVTVAVPSGAAVVIRLHPSGRGVRLSTPGRPRAADREAVVAAARRILNLDLDLEPFHTAVGRVPGLDWIARCGSGRLLRCATVFEDLIKLVLTTNCNWALTTRMCAAMVGRFGASAPDGSRAFPSPAALAAAGVGELRREVRCGYRAPYVSELARSVQKGEVRPEDWASDPRPAGEIRRDLLRLPGVGPYVAENLLKLLGRPAGLALDSWMRSKYARLYHGGRRVSDTTIARRYRKTGRWSALAVWCDLTRDWLDAADEPSEAWDALE